MKIIKYFLSIVLFVAAVISCTEDEFGSVDFVSTVTAPANLAIHFDVTPDDTGLVTIAPNSEGAVSYSVTFGDETTEPVVVKQGESVKHIYAEDTYSVKIVASGITGLTTEFSKDLVVSLAPPEILNLPIVPENSASISKRVDVTVDAKYAISYDVYFGEEGNDEPVTTNIGEEASYVYAEAGIYTIRVVVKGAASETAEYIVEDFEVTEILQPIESAPTPPFRQENDVISIFSSAYTDVPDTDYFPDWGQGGQGSSWALFNLNGDEMLQYINLSYQGIALADGTSVDVSSMEFIHLDVWTPDEGLKIETSLISLTNGEKPVWSDLTANEWTSVEIPISAFTEQGLTVADIFQLKFVGDPWAAGTVFIDNIYFWKEPTGVVTTMLEDFEGEAPIFTDFGNAVSQVIPNPDASGINTSSTVASQIKGNETWAGSLFDLGSPIDFDTFKIIKVKTWSPKEGAVVKLKVENTANADENFEIDMTTTVTDSWEELTYDFSDIPAGIYDRVVIFFDFGTTDSGVEYYFDEIQLSSLGGANPEVVFEDFEGEAPTFTDFGNAVTQVISNPDASGLNTSSMVASQTKGNETWAGSLFDLGSPIDFDTFKIIKIKTWSPKVGAVVKLKVENTANADENFEIDMTTTVADSWEELTYDFSDIPAGTYDRMVIFFDFGTTDSGVVYYVDDFTLTY